MVSTRNGALEVREMATPANPTAGKGLIYPKSDGRWYTKQGGVEKQVAFTGDAPTAHTHDDRYYTETEIDNLLAQRAFRKAVYGTLSNGWIRIANNPGDRAAATFIVYENNSSRHNWVKFQASSVFGNTPLITILDANRYGTQVFTRIRILDAGTYDPPYLEIEVANAVGGFSVVMLDNEWSSGWYLQDPSVTATIPAGYTETVLPIEQHVVGTTGIFSGKQVLDNGSRVFSPSNLPQWSQVSGKPTTFPPSGHSHAIGDLPASIFHEGHHPDWNEIAGRPSTYPPATHGHALTDANITGVLPIAQIPSTVFHTGHLPDWSEVAGKPSTFTPAAHTHSLASLSDASSLWVAPTSGQILKYNSGTGPGWRPANIDWSELTGKPSTFPPSTHGHALTDANITGVLPIAQVPPAVFHEGHLPDWNEIAGRPSTFPPSTHGHALTDANITGVLPIAQIPSTVFHTGHLPDWSEVAGKPSTFAPSAHTLESHSNVDSAAPADGDGFIYESGSWKHRPLTLADLPDAWVKRSVRAATHIGTGNITLSGLQTIDGVALAVGDRVLVKNQTNPAQNGIYTAASGAWPRAAGANISAEIAGATLNIDAGGQGGQTWTTSFKSTDTLGTTAMNWYRILDDSRINATGGVQGFLVAGTTAQYFRGDKTWQTLNPAAVGAAAASHSHAIGDLPATLFHTGHLPDWSEVAGKPSTFAPASHTLESHSNVLSSAPTAGDGLVYESGSWNHRALTQSDISGLVTALGLLAPKANPTFTGTVTGVTKAHVGLGSVDNTSDAAKPISTATQNALNGKAAAAHVHGWTDINEYLGSVDRVALAEQSSITGQPASGSSWLYSKSDGLLYFQNDDGVEVPLTSAVSALHDNPGFEGTWTTMTRNAGGTTNIAPGWSAKWQTGAVVNSFDTSVRTEGSGSWKIVMPSGGPDTRVFDAETFPVSPGDIVTIDIDAMCSTSVGMLEIGMLTAGPGSADFYDLTGDTQWQSTATSLVTAMRTRRASFVVPAGHTKARISFRPYTTNNTAANFWLDNSKTSSVASDVKHKAKVVRGSGDSNQVLNTGSNTKLVFAAEEYDTHDLVTAVGGTFTAKRPGFWIVSAGCKFAANTTGRRELLIRKGTTEVAWSYATPGANVAWGVGVNWEGYMVEGETIELWGFQNSGGNLNVTQAFCGVHEF